MRFTANNKLLLIIYKIISTEKLEQNLFLRTDAVYIIKTRFYNTL